MRWFRKAKSQTPPQSALLPLSCYSCILMSSLKLFLETIIIQGGAEIYIKCIQDFTHSMDCFLQAPSLD
jgi:hypothetical protein